MTSDELNSVLEVIGAESDGGWKLFPSGCTATFQVACDGVGMTVSRATGVRLVGTQLQVRTERGDTCIVGLAQVFACVVDGSGRETRRAGFAGS